MASVERLVEGEARKRQHVARRGFHGVDAAAVSRVRGAARGRDLQDDQALLRDGGLEAGGLAHHRRVGTRK